MVKELDRNGGTPGVDPFRIPAILQSDVPSVFQGHTKQSVTTPGSAVVFADHVQALPVMMVHLQRASVEVDGEELFGDFSLPVPKVRCTRHAPTVTDRQHT